MDLPVSKGTLWRLFGLALYLVGLTVALLVVVDVFTSGGVEGEFATQRLAVLLIGVVLIMVGRGIAWKFGNHGLVSPGQPPQKHWQTPLERLGYVTSDPPEEPPPEPRDEASVVCSECGTYNERGFTYCHNCSAELPE